MISNNNNKYIINNMGNINRMIIVIFCIQKGYDESIVRLLVSHVSKYMIGSIVQI